MSLGLASGIPQRCLSRQHLPPPLRHAVTGGVLFALMRVSKERHEVTWLTTTHVMEQPSLSIALQHRVWHGWADIPQNGRQARKHMQTHAHAHTHNIRHTRAMQILHAQTSDLQKKNKIRITTNALTCTHKQPAVLSLAWASESSCSVWRRPRERRSHAYSSALSEA